MSYNIENGEAYQALNDAIQTWKTDGYGVVDVAGGDCLVTVSSGNLDASDTLSIAPGEIADNGTTVSVGSQTVGINSVGSGYRYDTVWIDSGGTAQVTEGTAVSRSQAEIDQNLSRFELFSPSIPFPSTTPATVIAVVAVNDSDSSITSGNLQDRRVNAAVTTSAVTTERQSLTDPSLVYVWGANGNLLDVYDPAAYTDVFDALNQVMADVPDSDQVEIILPYTGGSGVNVSTTFTIPAGQATPTLRGWGWYGTLINYTATDGTPAIEVPSPENEEAYTWANFALSGPGSGAGGGGNGIQIGETAADSTNHGQNLTQIRVTDFPGKGIEIYGFFTGRIGLLQVADNGGNGIWVDRLNAGNIQNCDVKRNGDAQIYLRDAAAGVVGPGNNIDAAGGGATPAGSIGVRCVSVNKRGAPFVIGNYFEQCETHVSIENGGLPPRAPFVMLNRFQSGDTGIHLVDDLATSSYGSYFAANWFSGINSEDILLDGTDAALGPNVHANSTNNVVDNTGGSFASVSQTVGSYPW